MTSWSSRITRLLLVPLALLVSVGTLAPTPAKAAPAPFTVLAFHTPNLGDTAHVAYANHALKWFADQASANGYTFRSTTDWDKLKTLTTAEAKVVIFLDNSPGDGAQTQGFKKYMESGGGWLGYHVAAYNDDSRDPATAWYFDTFLGTGTFKNNSWGPTPETLKIDNRNHPATAGLAGTIQSSTSEWYDWNKKLRQNPDIDVLASLAPSTFPVGDNTNPDKPWERWSGGDFPIVWSNKKFKMVYANFGHEKMNASYTEPVTSTFDSPAQNKLILNSLKWVADGSTDTTPPVETGTIKANTNYTLRNKATSMCVDARAAASGNGTVIQQYGCNGTNAQKFQFATTSGGFGRIKSTLNLAQVLDVTDVSKASGAGIQLWAYGNGANQQWKWVAESGGSHRFVNKNSNLCLASPGSGGSVQLVQATCNGSAAQSFALGA